MRRMSLMMGIGILWACIGNALCGTADAAERGAAASNVVIRLERAACYGECPVYTVTLHGNGRVDWNGERYVAKLGPASRRIKPGAVAALRREIDRAGFWRWPDHWECARVATDHPWTYITVVTAARSRRIKHYHGNACVPDAVSRLEQRIDEVAGTAEWVGSHE
jgi:hypothetical protein